MNFVRRHRIALISLCLALLAFLALYWIAVGSGPGAFHYVIG